MKLIWSFLLICVAGSVMAQDDSQIPDTRKKNEGYRRMLEKDIKSDLAAFAFAALEDRLGKTPLQGIPATDYGANYITFEGNHVLVTIRSAPFEPAKHKLEYYEEKHLIKIDKKPYYGSYGTVPQYAIGSVTVQVDKDTINIPVTAYADLYSPVFTYIDDKGKPRTHNAVYFSPDKRNIYIYMVNQETIGSYEVTWIIQDKKFLRRVVDSGILK